MRAIFCILIAILVSGCSSQQQRTNKSLCVETDVESAVCKNSAYIELHSNIENSGQWPAIGFAEFNEAGQPYDQTVVDYVLDQIKARQLSVKKPLLLVVFIHGWFHNAEQSDSNVIAFKNFLSNLQRDEQLSTVDRRRTVIGIYMGWQAKASENTVLQVLSYRAKKDLGLETGEEGVKAVLEKLADIRVSDQSNRLVLAGHSFGGGVLYYAVREKLLQEIVSGNTDRRKAYGDLVILVNPAIEANRFVELQDALARKQFSKCSTLAMASFTSEADTSLRDQFPAGMVAFFPDQFLSTEKKDLLTTPYGLYDRFAKYELSIDMNASIEPILTAATYSSALSTWQNFRAGRGSFDLGGIRLSPKSRDADAIVGNPVLDVKVSADIIQEHSEIWDPKFTYFLRGLVGIEFAKKSECPAETR